MDIWSLPGLTLLAIAGAVGLLGGIVSGVVLRAMTQGRGLALPIVLGLLGCLAGLAGGVVNIPAQKQAHAVDAGIANLKAINPTYAAIFKVHPQAEAELRATLIAVLKKPDTDQARREVAEAMRKIQEKYFFNDLKLAQSSDIKNLLVADADILRSLAARPKACLEFYHGTLDWRGVLPEETFRREMQLKAAIVENAVSHPAPPPAEVDRRKIGHLLVRAYTTRGYDLGHLDLLGQIDQLPPEKGCKVATEFSDALASLPDEDAGYLYKSLLLAGEARKAPHA